MHKKGDVNDVNNNRPISFLPILSKILGSAMLDQIVKHLAFHNLISVSQYGFRKGLSTKKAILSFINNVTIAFQNKGYTAASFLDLSKAFDCMSHDILIRKLSCYKFHSTAIKLLQSYLSDRIQIVNAEGVSSEVMKLNYGVPQGSILGPVLFLCMLTICLLFWQIIYSVCR